MAITVKDMGYVQEVHEALPSSMYVNNYRPPELPFIGQQVMYYIDGDKTKLPQPAVVCAVLDRQVDVVLIDGRNCRLSPRYEVSFIEDPRLRENDTLRGFGGWDFTPEKYELDAFRARLDRLESELGTTPDKPSKPSKN